MPSNRAYIVVVVFALALGIATRWPFLDLGLWSDDYIQYAMLKQTFPVERFPLDLFNYSDGSKTEITALMDFGFLPWWTHPNFQLTMFRPLSSALIYFDYYVLGFHPVACHLHSLFWWILLVISVALLFGTLLPVCTASLATVLFALEESNTAPLLWLANRNASISLCLSFLALWAYTRWRLYSGKRFLFLTLSAFSLALLAGEWALATLGYFFAYELVGSTEKRSKRLAALTPVGSLVFLYAVVRTLLYDPVSYSSSYIFPFGDAYGFLSATFQRLPALLVELIFSVRNSFQIAEWLQRLASIGGKTSLLSSGRELQNEAALVILAGMTAAMVLLVFLIWRRKSATDERARNIGWVVLGSFLSLIPMLLPPPTTRLILPASLGFSALWSALLVFCYRGLCQITKKRNIGFSFVFLIGALLIFGFHCIIPVVRSTQETSGFIEYVTSVNEWILNADIRDDRIAEQDVVLVDSTDHTVAFYTPFVRGYHHRPLPKSCRILNASRWPYDITRTAENELMLSTLDGTLLSSEIETLYNNRKIPFRVGDRVELEGLTVDILRRYRGKPSQVRFVFDRTLEDPSYLFLHSTISGLRKMTLPTIGETARIPVPPEPGWARP
jgi:hypothetical protein